MTSVREPTSLEDIPTHDFIHFLHALRTRRLRMMPADARVVLSGGASGSVYFEWFGTNYPGPVERHIAVEYFAPPPDPLPDGVEWLPRTLGDLAPVADGEVDLVFAGQVIEHLWPRDIAGFLSESNRVLRPDGYLVIDSPTRFITGALGWLHPEHTVELEVDEIVELLELAGFVDIDVTGVWLCYDREQNRLMGLDLLGGGDEWPWQRRVLEAEPRPEDSFIWWAEARNGQRRGDADAVAQRAKEIYDRARPKYYERLVRTEVGVPADDSQGRRFRAARGASGLVLRGPGTAMPPGRHEAVFRVAAEPVDSWLSPSRVIAELEVTRDDERVIANWRLTARELPPGGAERELVLPFELRDTAFNCEFRVRSHGVAPLMANVPVQIREDAENGRKLTARRIGRDPAQVRARTALTKAQRIAGWPARRLLDPRLEGLRNYNRWIADRIGDRVDARANEISARIDGLAERVAPTVADSTGTDRAIVLPYVLKALGTLPRGSTIAVTDSPRGAVAVVLATLGYNVTSPVSDLARPIDAAVVRTTSVDDPSVTQVAGAMHAGGIIVLIMHTEQFDRSRLEQLLEDSQIDRPTKVQPDAETGAGMILTRAVLAAARER